MTSGAEADETTMFGCECALPFLTGLPGGGVRKGAASVVALGALMALGACDGGAQDLPRGEAADKVSQAIDKVDRQFERAKARLKKEERIGVSEGAASAQR